MRFIKDKFLFIVFTCLLFSFQASAQKISVSSFKLMENDMTANLQETMVKDFNGEVAALIKVVTTEQGFLFDGGMVGVVKTKQGVGEMWVYVPHGIKKMTINHPQLGVLRDYYFPVPIEKARTYEMVLTTGKVQTFVNQSLKKQFVLFTVTPANASVEFNGEPLVLDETGYAEIGMPYGTYTYRITCPDHHTTAGTVEVKEGGASEVNVEMRPDYGWLEVKAAPTYHGATIYVNGNKEGIVPLDKKPMKSGIYRVKVEKPLYKDYEVSVTIEDGKVYSLEVTEMESKFAIVELVVDEKSEIWVDGEFKGKGRWSGALGFGDHHVETKQMSHVPSSETIRISDTEVRVIQLKQPTPLYSSMEITSVPSRAKVYIDGAEVGMTPLVLNDVLIGERELVFEKEGYPRHTKYVMVNYGVSSSVRAMLTDASEQQRTVTNVVAQPVQQYTQQVETPTVSNTIMKQTEVKEGNGIELTVKHPSTYKLYVDNSYKGYFYGDKYSLGDLYSGEYKIKAKGKKYVGSGNFIVNSYTSDFYLKTKPRNNYFHSNASIYAGGMYTLWGCGGFKLGGYVKGINAEYNYATDARYQWWRDIRMGYGFNVMRTWLVTPQIGYYTYVDRNYYIGSSVSQYYDDYGYPFGQGAPSWYESEDYDKWTGVSLSCRLQYCFCRYVSLAVTPAFFLGTGGMDCEFGLIVNIPFTKK